MRNLPPNIWNAPAIRNRLLAEASFECDHGVSDKKIYWVVVPEADGKGGHIVLRNFEPKPFVPDPHEMQEMMATDLQMLLQKNLHHDGAWIVGWTHPPQASSFLHLEGGDNVWGRLIMIWLDEDADPKFTVESDHPVQDMVENGPKYYCGLAAQGYEMWDKEYGKKALKEDFGITSDQQTKAAQASMRGVS